MLPPVRPAVVALALLASVTACSGGNDVEPRSSPSVSPPASGPATDRFVYRVEDHSGGEQVVTTQVVDVAFPYVARIVNRVGEPPGGDVLGGSAWGASGVLLIGGDGSVKVVTPSPPGFTGGDAGLDVALPVAARLGWVERAGASSVQGTACTRWVSGPPLDSGTIAPAGHGERTTSCVDGTGRILADTWTTDGELLRRRELVGHGAGPALTPDGVDAGVAPTPLPSGSATQLTRDVDPQELRRLMGVRLPDAPPGTRLDRAVASVNLGESGTSERESATFTYVGDGRLVVVTFTRHLVGTAVASRRGEPVRLRHATGRVLPVFGGLRAELVTDGGLSVTVAADLPYDVFSRWLRTLPLA
jgi:hypothetical protein